MEIHYIGNNGNISSESIIGRNNIVKKLHEVGEDYLMSHISSKILTSDMDGVLIIDDNARDMCRIIGGDEALEYFTKVANSNIDAVARGETSYCWNAPCVFVGSILNGLPSEINSIVGKHMRFVPGTRENIEQLQKLGYNITNVTAGHQEGAQQVSQRLGLEKTIATQFGQNNGIYNGEILRFIGGEHKRNTVKKILFNKDTKIWTGSHIGDSHSDIETMLAHPGSIAWNPTHTLATHSARINVFGTNKQGLTPLFDSHGVFDHQIKESDLPQKIVICEDRTDITSNPHSKISQAQNQWGLDMRKIYGDEIDAQLSYAQMMQNIKSEIKSVTGLGEKEFKEHMDDNKEEIFLPIEEFQQNALKAYKRL